MKSSSKLSSALINVRNMSKNDSCAICLFDASKLFLKPIEHVSWVLEVGNGLPIKSVANISVERDDLSLYITKLFSLDVLKVDREVTPVKEVLLLLLVRDPFEPLR
jgi:hypothetical protein